MQQNKQLDENVNQEQSVKTHTAHGGAVSQAKLSVETPGFIIIFFLTSSKIQYVLELFSEPVSAEWLIILNFFLERIVKPPTNSKTYFKPVLAVMCQSFI